MVNYVFGDMSEQSLILTLNENQTTSEPTYVFQFIHTITKTVVQFIKYTTDDKSFWPERYNLFIIKPGELFTEPGEWHFKIIEQQSNVILEQGLLMINKALPFTYTKYHANTRYRTYRK